jgi:putative ATP-dependent endonuclease of the OLD family
VDYCERKNAPGFAIQAALTLPPSTKIGEEKKLSWPWEWNGAEAVLPPAVDDDAEDEAPPLHPVCRIQVRGTPYLELVLGSFSRMTRPTSCL